MSRVCALCASGVVGFEAHSRVEIKLVFLGLIILEILVICTWRVYGQWEERKGALVCCAQMPSEVGGPGLAWCGGESSWGISAEMGPGGANCHPSARELLQRKVELEWVAPRSWEATVTGRLRSWAR